MGAERAISYVVVFNSTLRRRILTMNSRGYRDDRRINKPLNFLLPMAFLKEIYSGFRISNPANTAS